METTSAKCASQNPEFWEERRSSFVFGAMSGVTRGIKLVVIGDGAVGKTW